MSRPSEPAFNVPAVVLAGLGLLVAVHAGRWLLTEDADFAVLKLFAFIPARYDVLSPFYEELAADGAGPKVWTFLTYALLHGDFSHLAVNAVWMLAFGSAVAWRFGTLRFLVFSAICAIAGAVAHLALHFGEPAPVVGASAAISGHMAAALRFMFEMGGPLGVFRRRGQAAFAVPAVPLREALRRPQVLIFLVVWFGTNIVFGLGATAFLGEGSSIAWEAHIGGFLAGLALFPLFDPKVGPSAVAPATDAGLHPPSPAGHDDDAERRGRP